MSRARPWALWKKPSCSKSWTTTAWGIMSTHAPIRFSVDVVGSTSTLVSERIEDAGLSAPPPIAGLLLAGLLSDTLILTSPTTTERDHRAAERLGRWAFVSNGPLAGETIQSYGKQVLATRAPGLTTRDPRRSSAPI